jgi:hypothetical protein
MSRQVANVDIITDSFEVWLLQTNELLSAFSTEIITANTTVANTGNNTIARTAQLWGTFGANTIAVGTALRGGNVQTGNSANLVITSNATAYVAADAGIRVLVGNSTSNSFMSPLGVHLGLGTANSIVNSSLIITQSSSTVNTNIRPTRIQVADSTTTANMTANAFSTGLFVGNTTMVAIGANVFANADTIVVGNSSFDSKFGNGSWTGIANLVITPTNYLTISGAANVTSNANFANTIAVTGNTTLSNTLAVTGNVILSNTIAVTGNATLSNTIAVTGNATFSNAVAITGNAIFSNTIAVTGNATLSNTLTVVGLANASGNVNTTTVNANVSMNVGANVNLSNTRITVGTGLQNTFITATAIETDGTLTVTGATTLSDTLAVTNTATLSNTLTVAGLASLNAALNTTTANASTAVNIGANVNLTLDRFNVGNNTVNTFITATAIETDGTLTVTNTTTLSNTLTVAGLASLNAALNTTTANASVGINVGANVNLSNTRITVGTSSENTFITATAIETDGTLSVANTTTLSNTLSVTGATTLSNTLGVTGAATLSNTFGVTGAATLSNTMGVTGATTLSNTLSVTGLSTLSGAMNTTTANASVAMNVGANVNFTLTRINVGNATVNTFITSTAIETDGTLTVAGQSTLSGAVAIGGTTTFKTDYVVDVSANADIGNVIGAVLIYTFPKATYSSAKFEVQVKKGSSTQLSELVLAHNGTTDAYVTVYGTVASTGAASPLGTFIANTGSSDTNVNLYLQQTVANSAVKVIAHLIK